MEVCLHSELAIVPKRATPGSAGYDLFASKCAIVPARGHTLVETDVSICIPFGFYGRIASRSSLSLRSGIEVGAGVIDSDYRGKIGVILFNHSDANFEVHTGDRIAQLIVEQITTPEVVAVQMFSANDSTTTLRGAGGFGSTGK